MKQGKTGRLAFRAEGKWWKVYYAANDTMNGAVLISQILLRFVETQPLRKEAYMQLMRECFSDVTLELFGTQAKWPLPPQEAPEHEREK